MKNRKLVIVVIAIALAILHHAHKINKAQQPEVKHVNAPELPMENKKVDALYPINCLLIS